jgi:sterol desaturase/sphingolipid hydroxylase (fatty acid hydroxylase superfamily)
MDALFAHLSRLAELTEARDWLLPALAPLFLLAVAIEWWRWRGQGRHDLKDTLASLNLGGVYTLVDVALVIALVLPAMAWVWAQRLFTIEVTPLSFAALYLGVELCYYGFHRASHRIRWFWCAHVVHHGSEFMNFSTAMRQSWLYGIAGNCGGTLIVFDRLFGSFVDETEAVDYGLVRPVHSSNPVWLTLHEWVTMGRDILQPGPLNLRLKHLWAPPEWARPELTHDNPPHATERPSRPHGSTRP